MKMVTKKISLLPLDRIAIALMLVLSVIILLVISQGNVVAPRVRDFTWQHQLIPEKDISLTDSNSNAEKIKISKDHTSFSMTFTNFDFLSITIRIRQGYIFLWN